MSKTNKGLVEYAKAQLGLPYWYGTFGQTSSESLLKSKRNQYPEYYDQKRYKVAFTSQYGKRVHDCIGLIKGYLWSNNATSAPKYNAAQDTSANGMLNLCKEKGAISTIPELPGVLVFFPGHVGVYIGNGYVIEARGHDYGVVKTKLSDRPWKNWGKCPYITYESEKATSNTAKVKKAYIGTFPALPSRGYFKEGDKGTQVINLQKFLNWYGNYKLTVDGEIGQLTISAVKKFQSAEKLTSDGLFGSKSLTKAKTIKK